MGAGDERGCRATRETGVSGVYPLGTPGGERRVAAPGTGTTSPPEDALEEVMTHFQQEYWDLKKYKEWLVVQGYSQVA